jgi:vancomycin resistance protein VanW
VQIPDQKCHPFLLKGASHGFDFFPDDNRKIPFGTSATVFYNYIDLRIKNNLNQPVVLGFSFTEVNVFLRILSVKNFPFLFP